VIAALWGFAEATVFFIVPDVFTSRVALTHSPRQAFLSCGWAVLGALVGGHLLFLFARIDPASAAQLLTKLDLIPGISPELIASTGDDIRAQGAFSFFTSAFGGVPYKLCTLQASFHGIGYVTFLVMSVASRFLRFALVTSFALLCRHCLLKRHSLRSRTRIHLAVWAAFYASYFYVMSG
jgi:membrane protein YqaA with SNARE-associated domain